MWIKDTLENRSLAAVAARNANSATGLNLAQRACWHGGAFGLRMAGVGLLLAGLGSGMKQAGDGYDNVVGNAKRLQEHEAFEARMAQEQEQRDRERDKTLAAILEKEHEFLAATTIHAEGTVTGSVTLADGALVGLKSGQLVGLADGQQVALAKGGTVALTPYPALRPDPNWWTMPAIGQDAPRPPLFEPPPQLRAISATLPDAPRRSAQTEPLTCKGTRR